jgi:hypothetical protein
MQCYALCKSRFIFSLISIKVKAVWLVAKKVFVKCVLQFEVLLFILLLR